MPSDSLDQKRQKIEALLRQARGLDPGGGYAAHKDRAGRRQREQTLSGRDVGAIPDVADPARRLAASASFRLFCETYFPLTFSLAWSRDHLRAIARIEESVLSGGLFAYAMPRGAGKTSLCECAALWAMLDGHRDFIALIGSDEGHAGGMLDSVKTELDGNDLLAADFPEACRPIVRLEGIANRCAGQVYLGDRTHVGWTADEVVLPTLKPEGWPDKADHRAFVRGDGQSLSSGAIVKVAGITGGIRGMKFKRPDGKTVRPSLVILDDPQTDQSARSPSQCQTRERILAGAILGLAGPGRKIAGIMPCTVIRPGDMADSILDRDRHPDWNGTRTKMVYAFPGAEKLWEEYARLRADGLRAGDGGRSATEFYAANREAMDAGSEVSWAERKHPDELSAIQHAMNLRLRDERAFFAEYQNEPLPEEESRPDDLTPDQVATKVNRLPRGAAAVGCNRVTAFVDVQATLLYYAVAAWEDDFTGYVLDYGAFPDQRRDYFTLRDATRTLADATDAPDLEGRLYQGLDLLCAALCSANWPRDDGADLKIERLLIDANWGQSTPTVKRFCRQSSHAAVITPSHGHYVGAGNTPMGEWPRRAGEKVGQNWRLRTMQESRGVRSVVYDTNWWKTFLATRLAVPMGSKTCLSLFGDKPAEHRMLADHLCAEYRVRTEGRGRTVDEWKLRPERPDNHLLDCLTGACVAASMQGVALADPSGEAPAAKPKRVSFAELQRRKRA